MARQPRVIEEATPPVEPVTESITYLPGDGDPASITWCGHKFHANVAKEITGHAEGSERDKLNLHLIERARENNAFRVGNAAVQRNAMTAPKTSNEYRAYFIKWIKAAELQHAEQLIARFAKERDLRHCCDVGSDDYEYLSTLLMPKLHELARGDELNETQVASLWIAHGFNELPW